MPNKLPVLVRWPVISLLYAVLILVLVPTWIGHALAGAGLWLATPIKRAIKALTNDPR